jgi:hypothetical protein
MNVNVRNRRQKLYFQTSFESDEFDIYDPVYTS